MNKEITKLLFALLNCIIHDRMLSESEAALFSTEKLPELYALSKKHDLAHIISESLIKNNLMDENDEYCRRFQKDQFSAIFRDEQNGFTLKGICDTLEKSKIPFIPLKGSVIKFYYPATWMRTSSDIDILIDKKNLSKAEESLVSHLSFAPFKRTNHDSFSVTPYHTILELHFDLIEHGKAKNSRQVLARFWDNTQKYDQYNYKYAVSDEMFYFYHIAHMAKHFETGGCGIKPFIDLWFLNHKKDFDVSKRNALLKEGGLLEFAKTCELLCEIWFGNGVHTDTTLKAQSYILFGGVYGNAANAIRFRNAQSGGKLLLIIKRILPSYETMRGMYPYLIGRPLLLPFFHIKRWCRIIFKKQTKRALNEFKTGVKISDSERMETVEFMKEIGLF